jgi:hypothetical protein
MCCFSGNIREVSGTSIFVRPDGERQVLAYQMHLSSAEDVAMILPLPIVPGRGEQAVELVDLSEAPQLFDELASCFPAPPLPRGVLALGVAGRGPTLAVHEVGAYDASFVPRVADFSRLDPRFRIPEAVLGRVPAYADYGFAVFKLRSGEAEVHPLGLRFATRSPERLFFPTVHVHHGAVPDLASFDHTLYLQAPAGKPADWEEAPRPVAVSLGNFLVRDPTRGLVARDWRLFRLRISGMHPNRDTWTPLPPAA